MSDDELCEAAACAAGVLLFTLLELADHWGSRRTRAEAQAEELPKSKRRRPNLDDDGNKISRPTYDDRWHESNAWWRLYRDPHTANPKSKQGTSCLRGC